VCMALAHKQHTTALRLQIAFLGNGALSEVCTEVSRLLDTFLTLPAQCLLPIKRYDKLRRKVRTRTFFL
jgi:hypothetical protein